MVRGKRPVRGGKRKFNRSIDGRPKPKKGKFNLKEASYIKERAIRYKEIENRRRILEEEKSQQQELQSDNSGDEQENPMRNLLSTFSNSNDLLRVTATEFDSESDHFSDDDGIKRNNLAERSLAVEQSDSMHDEAEYLAPDLEEIKMKEDDEEDPETAREDAGHLRDPFSLHLHDDLSDKLYEAVSTVPQIIETRKLTWPVLGNLICQIPKHSEHAKEEAVEESNVSILENKKFAKHGTAPRLIDSVNWNKLYVKSQIHGNITRANYPNINDNTNRNQCDITPLQKELFAIINNYQDLYYPERTFSNAEQIRFIYCLHVVNHALKTRTKILHHNAKITKSISTNMAEMPDEYRDQGLVRPKILIIVPFRHSCLKIVQLLTSILIGEDKGGSVINKKRFMEDFSGNELTMSKINPKPEDYELTFQGNTDDTFKIGIAITKKTLKLYSEFYSSDIIISSLLGLRILIGAEGEAERDFDFLASIELLILDQAELFLMQNWDHMVHVLNHLHLQPKDFHGTDFSRVRSWIHLSGGRTSSASVS
ncbi:unnamed protein product [Xylocopa violacea]|uniref:UTP25 NTP hydrolase-like domain-containing protein n=1 Tax=Xylocopa violacea TaxID=135666 RepID=A0ABP1PFA5_XYLVO